jgi:hypothetical protein
MESTGLQILRNVKAAVNVLLLLTFCISLFFAYQSEFYSNDFKVLKKQARADCSEKLEVATGIHTSPAECLLIKPTEIVRVFHPGIFRLAQASSIVNLLCKQAEHRSFQGVPCNREIIPWRPSIVVAFRRLLI